MKTRKIIVSPVLILCVFAMMASCATNKMAYASKDYEIYGTWFNPDYVVKGREAVFVFNPNNLFESYDTLEKEKLRYRCWYDITGKWIDRKGNIWYTLICILNDRSWNYYLAKISNSGKTLELMSSASDYPKEINPNNIGGVYKILYRQ